MPLKTDGAEIQLDLVDTGLWRSGMRNIGTTMTPFRIADTLDLKAVCRNAFTLQSRKGLTDRFRIKEDRLTLRPAGTIQPARSKRLRRVGPRTCPTMRLLSEASGME
jgi:hypothetical protein